MLTAKIIEILLDNARVREVVDRSINNLVDAFTKKETPNLLDRKEILESTVNSLEVVAGTVTDYLTYYSALVALCFDVAAIANHGVLVEDLFAKPHWFFFPAVRGDLSLDKGEPPARSPDSSAYAVYDSKSKGQSFFAITTTDQTDFDGNEVRKACENSDDDKTFLSWLRASELSVIQLIGLYEEASQTYYLPYISTVPSIRLRTKNAKETREQLKRTLLKALAEGDVYVLRAGACRSRTEAWLVRALRSFAAAAPS